MTLAIEQDQRIRLKLEIASDLGAVADPDVMSKGDHRRGHSEAEKLRSTRS